MLTCEYDHVRLRSAAADVVPCSGIFRQQLNPHRKALRFAQPALIRRNLRQLAGRHLVTLLDAPADALNPCPEEFSRTEVERDQDLIPRQNVSELVLAQIGRNPTRAVLEKAQQRLSAGDI